MNCAHTKDNFLDSPKVPAFQNDKHLSKCRRNNLLSRDRLNVPMKGKEGRCSQNISEEQSQRLISISSDEDSLCDIYSTQFVSGLAGDEMIEFLRRDGFDLGGQLTTAEPDHSDLELLTPHLVTKRRSVCSRLLCCDKWKKFCCIA